MADVLDDLKKDFPALDVLTHAELDAAISRGGLFSAFIAAHAKVLGSPPKVGRPKKAPKSKKVIPRRGRKSLKPITPWSTVTQVAEMAQAYQKLLGGRAADAAKATLIELTGKATRRDIRRVEKMMSGLSGRAHDRQVRARRALTNASSTTQAANPHARIVRF